MNKGLTKQLLLSSNYWVLNKDLVQLLGLETAFLLSNFAEAENMMSDKEGWFYQTSETVEKMTTLSRHKQDQCIKQLEKIGILEKHLRGMPAKRYFRINYKCLTNKVVKFQQTRLLKISKQDCQKLTTNKESSYKESSYKESSYKESTTEEEEEQKENLTQNNKNSIIEEWNKLDLQNLVSINSNTKRHSMLQARIREYSLDEVIQAIRLIDKSSFLKGQNSRGWTITFDWLVRPNNFIKVLEGNYTDETGEGDNDERNSGKSTKVKEEDDKTSAEKAGVLSL